MSSQRSRPRAHPGEMHRVCRPGGEIAALESYQQGGTLDPIPFIEPYLKEFLRTG